MCPCHRHYNIMAVCTCKCDHGRVLADFTESVYSTVREKMAQRLRIRIYRHTHECSQKGAIFRYYPPTQGGLMFPVVPVCIEADVELELISRDGENWREE
jgi:hypothetical protein